MDINTSEAVSRYLSENKPENVARASMGLAIGANPDQEAEYRRLAQQSGVPVETVRTDPAEVKKTAALKSTDFGDLASRFPSTTGYLSNIDNAKIAHDDIGSLTGIEQAIRFIGNSGKALASSEGQANSGLWGLAQAAAEFVAPALDPLAGTVLPENPMRRAAAGFADMRETAKARAKGLMPKGEGNIEQGYYAGLQSLGTNLAMLPLALAGGPQVGLAAMSAPVGGSAYGEARDKGMAPAGAAVFGASQAAIEYATEKLPLGRLLGDLKAGTPFYQMLVRQAFAEVPGEQIATALQDMNEWAALNPEKPFSDYIKERPSAIVQTFVATLVGVGGQVSTVKAADMAIAKITGREQQAQKAQETAATLKTMADVAAASKVRQRDTQSFQAFVESATKDGPVPELFIDPRALAQSGVTAEELASISQTVADQLPEALATGGDIRIPTAEFAATIAGTPLADQMLPHLKTEAGGMSQAEAEEFMTTQGDALKAEVEATLSRQEGDAAFKASRDAVQANILQQLTTAGRFGDDVNKPYAALVAARYGTLANQLGITPEEVFAQYPLTIQAQGTQGRVLNQTGEIDDLTGLPLNDDGTVTVYHHTSAEKAAQIQKTGRLKSAAEPAVYFTSRKETDTGYGDTVVAVRVRPDQLQLDDEFPDGRLDFSVDVGRPGGSLKINIERGAPLAQGDATPRATFSPETMTISLLEKADLTSFLHEAGHAFLEMQAKFASQPNAPQQVLDDMNTLLAWFGIQPAEGLTALETWNRLSLDEQRESHEKFARGFEAYLFEGRAPSMALQGPFARFRAWMLNVYQSLKALNVKLTDEVRGVMDRMIATEQEVETAEAARSMGMMFATQAEAEALGVDWAAYQALGVTATESAITELGARSLKDMQWLTGARAKILKSLQKDAADKRREVRAEVRAEVLAQPIYRAWSFLTGKAPKPTEPSDAEIEYRRELKDWKQRRVEAEQEATKAERAAMLDTQPGLKGLERGQFIAKNRRQIGINVQQRMLEWDKANAKPAQPAAAEVDVPPGFEVGKMDRAMVEAIGKPLAEALGKYRMLKAEGMSPDIVAEQFGFLSGDQLVNALALADPPAVTIEALTDQRMLERYGDLTSKEAIDRAADEAVHNIARQRAVATELKALEDASRVRQESGASMVSNSTVATLPRAAKQFAEQMIARLKVKDIKPARYTAAEARAARNSTKALKAGDIALAAQEKRNQLVNGYASRAASDALAEVRDMLAFFKRVNTGNRETIAKSRDVDLVMAMRAILADYGIGTKGEAAQEYLKAVERNDPATYAVIKDKVDGMTAAAQPYTEVSMEKLRGLHDELQGMWHLARRSRQIEIDGQTIERAFVQDELVAKIEAIGVPERVPGEGMAVTNAERALTKVKTYLAALRRVESWASAKDGEAMGPFRKYVWQPVKDAADAYRADKAKFLKRYRDLLSTVDLGRARIAAPELGYTFGASRGGSAKQEILHALLHTGNPSNKRKLLLGRGWAVLNQDDTLDTTAWDAFVDRMVDEGVIGKAEYDFVQGVWDLLEDMKPAAQKAHRDVFGRYFDEVTAEGFVTPFGTYRGGYVPAMTDSEVVKDAATRALAEAENSSLAYAFPTTNKGFTKARVEYNKPLLLDLRSLSQHIDKVLLFTHMEQPIRDVRKILTSNEVSEPLHRIDPTAYDTMLTPWLNRSARQQVETPSEGSNGLLRFFSVARSRAGMAALFANLSNTAQQITGLSIALVKVNRKQLLSAAAQYIKAPRTTAQAVAAASPYMAARMDNEVAQMNDAINDILLNPSVYEKAQAWSMKHAYFLQSAVDNVIGPIVWTGAYNQALEAGQSERDAVRLADSAVRETQGSTLAEDVSRLETGHPVIRAFTQFMGYFNMQANLLGTEFVTIMRSMGLRAGMGRGLFIFTLGYLVPAILSEAIVQAFRGGPDDEDKDGEYLDDWLAALGLGTIRSGVAMIPVIGPVLNVAMNAANSKPYDDRISTSPAISMIESAGRAPFSVYDAAVNDGSTKKAVRDVATLISMTTGLPANAVARPVIYGSEWLQGNVEPEGVLDATRGMVTGIASPESQR